MAAIDDIVERRRTALIKSFVLDPYIMVQCPNEEVGRLAKYGSGTISVDPLAIGRFRRRNALHVAGLGDVDIANSIWVRTQRYEGYRPAYIAFVKRVYGLELTTENFSYEVDHLLNAARSRKLMSMSRLEALPREVNGAWGRLFEKASSHPGFYANQFRSKRTLEWAICAKLACILPPDDENDLKGVDKLIAFYRSIGIEHDAIEKSFLPFFEFAYSLSAVPRK